MNRIAVEKCRKAKTNTGMKQLITAACLALAFAAVAGAVPQKKSMTVSIRPDAASHVYETGAMAKVSISVGNAPKDGQAEVWADDGWTNIVWRHTLVFSNETSVVATLTRSTPGSFRIHVKGGGIKERMDRVLFGVDEIAPLTPRPDDFEAYWRGLSALTRCLASGRLSVLPRRILPCQRAAESFCVSRKRRS